jgi:hypothetical protein
MNNRDRQQQVTSQAQARFLTGEKRVDPFTAVFGPGRGVPVPVSTVPAPSRALLSEEREYLRLVGLLPNERARRVAADARELAGGKLPGVLAWLCTCVNTGRMSS